MPVALLKRSLIFLVAAFAIFYVLTQPEGAASAIEAVAGGIADAFDSLMSFFAALAE